MQQHALQGYLWVSLKEMVSAQWWRAKIFVSVRSSKSLVFFTRIAPLDKTSIKSSQNIVWKVNKCNNNSPTVIATRKILCSVNMDHVPELDRHVALESIAGGAWNLAGMFVWTYAMRILKREGLDGRLRVHHLSAELDLVSYCLACWSNCCAALPPHTRALNKAISAVEAVRDRW